MLIESTAHLPISLAMLQDVFNAPEPNELWRILLRWFHFLGGVTWIGLLYFFNLVNVPFQKGIDADTWHIAGMVLKNESGELVGEYYFRDIKVNPKFADDLFTRKTIEK